ncbi:UDP-glucose dehydrogenase family protein [Dethiobacter alkaliphilus]|uniref:UDP-glucose dehydrogenase family protein n=1 Tax=Dethiobacter alkaliphilus TaxID=427926 RepID=UPI0022273408|nr:UDP-glucose/GDP-mannose dehydrogenase family protein [Dethiobacter alkaliphilus]MCW3489905.1 UDP-glucose/GDP-mannose dehydrogenase family protein [Dethiobacter alkaliphilus]
MKGESKLNNVVIGVVGGLGHIGLIQSACLAGLGYNTIAYDIDKEKIAGVLNGKLPFEEAGLQKLVRETVNDGLLKITAQIDDLEEAEIVFICVGTPSLSNGEADLSQVYQAVEQMARNRNRHCLAVIKSTVPVGASAKLTAHLKKLNLSNKVTMVSNPEFLREGSGVEDFWNPARIVVGSEIKEAGEKVAGLYAPDGVPVIITSWESSELIKLASNAFLSTKISFINEISILCEQVGADVRTISKGIGLDPRINPHFLAAGVGFSGPCLEKDLQSLIDQFKKTNQKARILESVLEVNETLRHSVVEKLLAELGRLKDKNIAVLGMAFKEETDDVRQSHSLPIVQNLISQGAMVTVTDPWVKSPEQAGLSEDVLPGVTWVDSPYAAAKDKDAILILTAWQEYRDLDLARIKQLMANPLIVDGRNLFNKDDLKAQEIKYQGVGI